jgi:hypothetical protein
MVRGARARWKIENETFNTLKNQGYHIEHRRSFFETAALDMDHKIYL